MSYCSNEYACVRTYSVIANPSLLCSTHPTPYHFSADKDYRTLDIPITIPPRQNYTFNVQIRPDEEPEFPEDFYIDLTIASDAKSRGVHLASPNTAKVVIEDDDCEWCSNIQTLHAVHQRMRSHILNSAVRGCCDWSCPCSQ